MESGRAGVGTGGAGVESETRYKVSAQVPGCVDRVPKPRMAFTTAQE